MMQRLLLLILCLILCPGSLAARGDNSALADLSSALDTIERLQGSFVQRQYDTDGAVLATSRGTFKLLRPGYFAWDIQSPDSQLVVADPDYIWHHDRDLDTVTRRPAGGEAALSPLQVLGGEEDALERNYTVTAGTRAGEFVLTPRASDASFDSLTLRFDKGQLHWLSFTDKLGQRVDIELDTLDSESPLSSADFAFAPPPGADLFYDDK